MSSVDLFPAPLVVTNPAEPSSVEHRKEATPCVFSINGRTYDVSNWVSYHPGGEVISKFHGCDASEVFTAFHTSEAWDRLSAFEVRTNLPHPAMADAAAAKQKTAEATAAALSGNTNSNKKSKTVVSSEAEGQVKKPALMDAAAAARVLDDYRKLRAKVETDGLMRPSALWYVYKTATTVGLFAAAAALCAWSATWTVWFVAAVVLALGYQQAGWLAHDYLHLQVLPRSWMSHWAGLLLGNVLQGFSATWWKARHNAHHASTNVRQLDPDIDNLPLLAWHPEDLERLREDAPLMLALLPYQPYYFMPVVSLLRYIWAFQSVVFVVAMQHSPNRHYQRQFLAEALAMALHHVLIVSFLLSYSPSLLQGALFWLFSNWLGGCMTAFVVFFNHYGEPHYDPADEFSFVTLQIATTRNMTPGVFTDWFYGGLNYQIEHHLFPQMPRHNLGRAQALVQQFCRAHNLDYQMDTWLTGWGHILRQLSLISRMAPPVQVQIRKKTL